MNLVLVIAVMFALTIVNYFLRTTNLLTIVFWLVARKISKDLGSPFVEEKNILGKKFYLSVFFSSLKNRDEAFAALVRFVENIQRWGFLLRKLPCEVAVEIQYDVPPDSFAYVALPDIRLALGVDDPEEFVYEASICSVEDLLPKETKELMSLNQFLDCVSAVEQPIPTKEGSHDK